MIRQLVLRILSITSVAATKEMLLMVIHHLSLRDALGKRLLARCSSMYPCFVSHRDSNELSSRPFAGLIDQLANSYSFLNYSLPWNLRI